jgi:limonene-1,2-epoxide hydrolase
MTDHTTHCDATGTLSPTEIVERFFAALTRLDPEAAGEFLADDVVYHNVSMSYAKGKPAVMKQLNLLTRLKGFDVITHRIGSDGTTVLTERTDVMTIGPVSLAPWVCGTLEVVDGRIVLWRDYFDWVNYAREAVKGVTRALMGKLGLRRAGSVELA